MATVTVNVNGRPYNVGCEDGQEVHVGTLAEGFDRQVREVGDQVGQVGDLRLFLMAALVTADELADLKLRLARAEALVAAQLAGKLGAGDPGSGLSERRAADALNGAAQRIEALTAGLA